MSSYKLEVQGKIDTINALIESLQAADESLEQKIADLDNKVDAQRSWVETTFATLEQYNGLVDDIASIRTGIEAINQNLIDMETRLNEKIKTDIAAAVAGLESDIQEQVTEITDAYTAAIGTAREEITAAYTSAISSAIDDCVASMKSWVNEKLANYYDIAAIDAKIELLQEAIAEGDASADEKLASEIAAVNKAIETAKNELTEAYQEAIASAIETNNGVIDTKIAQQIQSVNNRIDEEVQMLTTRIDDIERRLSELEDKVDDMADEIAALLKRIQSVSYVPQYDDGKIEVRRIVGQDKGIAEMDFLISPKNVVTDLEKVWEDAVSVKAVHTKTRAVEFIEMPVVEFAADAETGVITVKASGENLGEEFFAGNQSASAALFISDGNSNVTSEYIPLLANSYDPLKTIFYTTSDGEAISPDPEMDNIIENKYENGQGIITFSDVVTEIPANAFASCKNITDITLPDGVTQIGDRAFDLCSKLTNISFSEGLTSIGKYAFNQCSLKTIKLPNSLTSIEKGAFMMCLNLTDIIFSDGLETIGEQAFSYCYGLTEISLPESITTIGDYAFIYCNNLFKVTVPNNITYLGKTVFGACYNLSSFSGQYTTSDHRCLIVNGRLAAFAPKGLTEYTIPDGVTTIGDNVFFGCTNLTRITIPHGVETIAFQAFRECSGITEITIPESVTTVKEGAFCTCKSLTTVYCKPIVPPALEVNIFSESPIGVIYVPQASVEAYKSADGWSEYANRIEGYDF
ncbi:leucine-rich repeat protein [uncultured Alistipes sp.]|uniref:leucine-rich repeat protein n=1 Tax=uncultured Alistipes sp. TaxID=538949 RepID=UPI00320B6CCF